MGIINRIFWRKEYNDVKNKLHSEIDTLKSPADTIFVNFLAAASVLLKSLIGPNEGFIDINLKKISIKQYRELYIILLCYFAFLFYTTNPSLREEMKETLLDLSGEPSSAKKILQSLEKTSTKNKNLDIQRVGSKVMREIKDRLGPNAALSASQFIAFIKVSTELYMTATDKIKESLN